MRSVVGSIAIAAVAALTLSSSVPAVVAHGCTTSTNFDYLELVLQWPVTSCKTSSCNATDAFFTLHGTDDGLCGGTVEAEQNHDIVMPPLSHAPFRAPSAAFSDCASHCRFVTRSVAH